MRLVYDRIIYVKETDRVGCVGARSLSPRTRQEESMKRLLIIGEMLIDLISADYANSVGDAVRFDRFAGGSSANIASNLADFGFLPSFVSKVGTDVFGDFLIRNLEERGIDVSYIQRDNRFHTSLVFVAKSKESPDFVAVRAADHHIEHTAELEGLIERCDYLHISCWPLSYDPSRTLVMKIVEQCAEQGKHVCFDPNYRPILWERGTDALQTLRGVFSRAFLCKPSEDDAFYLFGKGDANEYIEKFHQAGVRNVMLTLGKKGALISDGTRVEPLLPLAKRVVDTTGAGDGFWSGVYAGLLQGMDIFESARIGNAVATYRVEHLGGGTKLPALQEILKR